MSLQDYNIPHLFMYNGNEETPAKASSSWTADVLFIFIISYNKATCRFIIFSKPLHLRHAKTRVIKDRVISSSTVRKLLSL
jgi:hypothetical protein